LEEDKMSKQLMLSPEKCTGCRSCELICSFNRDKRFNPLNSAVSVVINDEKALAVPIMCLQCEEAYCANECPTEALFRDETGTVKCDMEKCTSCGLCVDACPLGCISINPKTEKIVKCDLCGGDPCCVKYCRPECLVFGDGDASARKKTMNMVLDLKKAAKEAS
jgi:Fe-S-cluster-containing hydrogenase component 2